MLLDGDLPSVYTEVTLDRNAKLERLTEIESTTRPKLRYTDSALPDLSVPVARLRSVIEVSVGNKPALNRAEFLLDELEQPLETILKSAEQGPHTQIADISR